MARTANTEGTVRETPKGSGWYRAMLPARLSTTGQRKYIEGRWRTKTDARRALRRAISDIEADRTALPSRKRGEPVRTVGKAVADYIDYREASADAPLAVHTLRGYRSDLKNHIRSPHSTLADTPLTRLTAVGVRQWINALAGVGTGPGTIDGAKRLLNAAMNHEVAEGRIGRNPVCLVRKELSKRSRAARQRADVVLLPSWREFADLVCHPQRDEDRLLIALLGWTGLRWSEAVSLEVTDLWRDRPLLTISRVLTKRMSSEMVDGKSPWESEPTKSGLVATVPLPRPLWRRLLELAVVRCDEPELPYPAGMLLFRAVNPRLEGTNSIGLWDNRNFTRKVWVPARTAAGLTGDPSLPLLEPRREAIKIKDLRAFAASVLLDSGASMTEAALLLRHANNKTTERFYARATSERAHDTARRAATIGKSLTLEERIDLLWDAWVTAYPKVLGPLGITAETGLGGPVRHLRVLPGVLDLTGPTASEERASDGF